MKVLTIITNGFEEIETLGTIDILRRGGVDLDIYSLHGTEATGKHGIEVKNLLDIKNLDLLKYDFLFIPGGSQYVELGNSEFFKNVILNFASRNCYIAAICAGPTLLGKLGLLKGKNYTCFKSMNQDFGGNYIEDYSVKDGKLITGISAAGTLDFAFKILEVIKGKYIAEQVKNSIYYYSKK